MVADALAAIKAGTSIELAYGVRNVNRSIGARLSGEIAKAHGGKGLPDDTIRINLTARPARASACEPQGLTLTLEGDANDYVGKGMGGGRVVIYRRVSHLRRPSQHPDRQHLPLRRQPAANSMPRAWAASASACATPARWRWWKASATTAANT